MADLADVAGEISDERLAYALENRQQYNLVSEVECLECGNEIPEQRRALGGVTLCIDCQTVVENENKLYRK
jgi:phage/conjugal plasmid C-4 type zinc finger TraR family protein